jgi:transcriptional regulator with XRE-family HTH domain
MNADAFWDHVKPLIKAQKITQESLAKNLDIPFGTFQGWIARHTLPDVVSAYRIAQALGVSVEYLVTGNEPEKPDTALLIAHAQALLEGLKNL